MSAEDDLRSEKENERPPQPPPPPVYSTPIKSDSDFVDTIIPVSLNQSQSRQQVKEVQRLASLRSSPRLRQQQQQPQRGEQLTVVVQPPVGEGEPEAEDDIEMTQSPEHEHEHELEHEDEEQQASEEEDGMEVESEGEVVSSEEGTDGEGEDESSAIEDEEDEVSEDEMDNRSEGERESIELEMSQLVGNVPQLDQDFRLVDRLGEGTFSSVYKAVDLRHEIYDNSLWTTAATITTNSRKGKVYVALKRIYVTSSPERILNELEILNDLRGKKNVAYLIQALRHEDQVIAVMPFNRHQDFRTYYRCATLPLLRSYFAALFRALSSTHSQHILHRDVKPANFLYDVHSGTGTLCDYGLAQKIGGDEWQEWRAQCCHSLPGPSWEKVGLNRTIVGEKMRVQSGKPPGLCAGLHGVRLARPVSLWEQVDRIERDWNKFVGEREEEEEEEEGVWRPDGNVRNGLKGRYREELGWYKNWRVGGMLGAGGAQHGNAERVGFLKDDRRGNVRANRAGTRGFRAPEVLLKCPDQTVALDIWSAGIILLCFLTRRFPFFNSNDDTEALVEIAAIFGKKKMEKCAALHNRTFLSNIPSLDSPPHSDLHALVKSLNPCIVVENSPDPYGPIPSSDAADAKWYPNSELAYAVDLMKKCLETDLTRRWTAEECLKHPFFENEGVMFDYGGGVVGKRRDIDM